MNFRNILNNTFEEGGGGGNTALSSSAAIATTPVKDKLVKESVQTAAMSRKQGKRIFDEKLCFYEI